MNTWRFAVLLRLGVVVIVPLAVILAAANAGFLSGVYASDHFFILHGMLAIFILATFSILGRAVTASRTLNDLEGSEVSRDLRGLSNAGSRANYMAAVKTRAAQRLKSLRSIPGLILLLGLLGTVAGFMEALQGISAEGMANVASLPATMGGMLSGMFSAFSKTLAGGALSIWLSQQIKVLETAEVSVLTKSATSAEKWHAAQISLQEIVGRKYKAATNG